MTTSWKAKTVVLIFFWIMSDEWEKCEKLWTIVSDRHFGARGANDQNSTEIQKNEQWKLSTKKNRKIWASIDRVFLQNWDKQHCNYPSRLLHRNQYCLIQYRECCYRHNISFRLLHYAENNIDHAEARQEYLRHCRHNEIRQTCFSRYLEDRFAMDGKPRVLVVDDPIWTR